MDKKKAMFGHSGHNQWTNVFGFDIQTFDGGGTSLQYTPQGAGGMSVVTGHIEAL